MQITNTVVGVYLLQSKNEFDKEYSYLVNIESDYAHKIKRGSFVTVPFGSSNRPTLALVWSISEADISDHPYKLKYVSELCEKMPIMDDEQMEIAWQIHERFFCTVGDAIRCFISRDGYKQKSVKILSCALSQAEAQQIINSNVLRNINQINILKLLLDNPSGLDVKEVMNILGLNSDSAIKTLIKKEILQITETLEDDDRQNIIQSYKMNTYSPHILNEEQEKAYNFILKLIKNNKFAECLLHGVTGSGKTEVYMQIIAKVIENGGSAMVLVPEISLTPQMIAHFTARFGSTVATLHSRLTDAKRGAQWNRIRTGQARIVIGTRSAIFAPASNLSVIIIDEEHDGSYRSEDANPHYTAAEVAVMRAKLTNTVVVYGSATPLITTFHRAVSHEIYYMPLKKRANNKPLPECYIMDMRKARMQGAENSLICQEMKNEIIKNFCEGCQTIVFVHRRGYSGHVLCTGCGKTLKCRQCSIPMTYHAGSNRLVCHYCGNTIVRPERCPECNSETFDTRNSGTEKVAEEIQKMIPEASILRMDADTTAAKDGHAGILSRFAAGEAQILVGTQMIAKGHDFPNVTLVCVINADSLMNMHDYMAGERAYQLFTQVAGRAGRAARTGRVLIQAYDVDAYPLTAGAAGNYMELYRNEIIMRSNLNYPPFCAMCTIRFSGEDDKKTYIFTRNQLKLLNESVRTQGSDNISILGPARDTVVKINNKYRWNITIKADSREKILQILQMWINVKKGGNNISVNIKFE